VSADTGVQSSAAEELRPAIALLIWGPFFFALSIWVAHRLGAFDLWSVVTTLDGRSVRFPNGFSTVDHPFHTVRAETLRRALLDGEMLRWIGHHQGGYPVEFYPLGVAALEVAAWGLAFGSLPMIAVHKLVVIGIFLLPLVGYLLMAGFDRRSLGVALVAGAGHLCVRGWWWSGGSMELVEWGLVTNVAAVTALVFSLPFSVRFIGRGDRWAGGLAAALAAFALLTNPRSGIALVTLLLGASVAVLIGSRGQSAPFDVIGRRLAILIAIAGLLAAPEIVSLARFSNLYYFVHYSEYANLRDYLDSSVRAVGGPFFVLGVAGFALAWLPGTRVITRAVAVTLALYVAGTAVLVVGAGLSSLIDQLETTRLMPFQRLLWYFLAASAVEIAVIWLGGSLRKRSRLVFVDATLIAIAAIVLLLYVVQPPSFIPVSDRGLVKMPTSAQPGIVDLDEAVHAADGAAAPGTALLVLGTLGVPLSWHDQLWAPLWSDRPVFYDDWLWYWQTKHYGAYNPQTEHAYTSDESALDGEYLQRHGIGAIVVTGDAKARAGRDSDLSLVRAGTWDVYRMNDPTSIVTFSGTSPEDVTVENQHVVASGNIAGGEIVVRRNWFPRWRATLNGRSVDIRQTEDGYMAIAAPDEGTARIELRYGLDWIDWASRIGAIAGAALFFWMILPRGRRLRLGASNAKPVPRAIPRVRSERR
jgi:hypothetical protein